MGLGVRVATKITEKNGGTILTSTGAKTAKVTWGKSFEWCDYSGELDGRRVGVTLMPDPANFRPSWFHNRDYGLMVANPFGRKSMNQGETSRVVVKKGERLSLRSGFTCMLSRRHLSRTSPPPIASFWREGQIDPIQPLAVGPNSLQAGQALIAGAVRGFYGKPSGCCGNSSPPPKPAEKRNLPPWCGLDPRFS